MQWIRRRQRTLTRVVLALFALAWLQAAAVPCAMAADGARPPPAQHAAAHHDCRYCPPAPQGATTAAGDRAGCAYSHQPQVDPRHASEMQFAAAPATPVVLLAAQLEPLVEGAPPRPAVISRPPIADSYCRRIE